MKRVLVAAGLVTALIVACQTAQAASAFENCTVVGRRQTPETHGFQPTGRFIDFGDTSRII